MSSINTISVIEGFGKCVQSIKTWKNDNDGIKESREYFTQLAIENEFTESEITLSYYDNNGVLRNGEYWLKITCSN